MTQSKDTAAFKGDSRRTGSQRSPRQPLPSLPAIGADRDVIALPPPPPAPEVAAPDTQDMQLLLRQIADQIADAERRQGAALGDMQERLTDLAGRAETARGEAPQVFQPGLSAIEGRIAEMAQSVATAGRAIGPPEAAANAAQPENGQAETGQTESGKASFLPPRQQQMHVRGFGRGQIRGPNASELAPDALAAKLSSSVSASALEAGEPWDQEAADALSRVYDEQLGSGKTGETAARPQAPLRPGAPGGQRAEPPAISSGGSTPISTVPMSAVPRPAPAAASPLPRTAPHVASQIAPQAAKPAASTPPPVKPPAAASPPPPAQAAAMPVLQRPAPAPAQPVAKPVPPAAPATAPAAKPAQPAAPAPVAALSARPAPAPAPTLPPGLSGQDRDWLTTRFAEIAAQVERSLKDIQPERALSAFGQRFDTLESRFETVVGGLRATVDANGGHKAIQSIDAQISALKGQLDAALARMQGIDALKAEIARIGARLEALDRLELAQARLSDEMTNRISGQIGGARGDLAQLARLIAEQQRTQAQPLAAAADPRIDALQGLIEAHGAERREGEDATVAVLQAIQGAIDQLSSRVQAFEDSVAHAQGHLESAQPAAEPAPFGARERRPEEVSRAQAAPQPAHSRAQLRQPAAEPAPAQDETASSDLARGDADVFSRPRRGGAGRATERAARSPATAQAMAFADEMESAAPPVQAPPQGRDDLIGAARRAAQQAAQQAARELAEAEAPEPAAGRGRATTQARTKTKAPRGGFFTFERGSSRSVQLVLLVALIAAGAGMLYGTLFDKPQPTAAPARLDKPKPAAKTGSLAPDADTVLSGGSRRGTQNGSPSGDGSALDGQGPTASAKPQRGNTDTAAAGVDAEDVAARHTKDFALATMKPSTDADAALVQAAAQTVAEPAAAAAADTQPISTGIMIDSGAPMPSLRDLQRFSQEQRMARISTQLGDKAVQKTEREHAMPALPAAHTPDATRPEASVESAPPVAPPAAQGGGNAAGLPPAQIGPMSLRVAAAKGDPSAEFEVASRFAQGKGVVKDFAKAAEWYARAASHGSAPAQYRLGGLYERGIGIKADAARARTWYKRAADLGNVKAMHNLAVMHTQRDGGEPDYATASQLFLQAASRGLSDSQFNLAILHENGMGLPKNPLEAHKWYALAAERGDTEAAKRRDAIAAKLTPAELDAARKQVADWRQQAVDAPANDPFAAGQAWRNRQNDEQSGVGGAAARPPAAMQGVARPVASPDSQVLDLTAAALEAKQAGDGTGQGGAQGAAQGAVTDPAAVVARKRKLTKVQNPADVEKLLTQLGYSPSALKQARPGGAPIDPNAPLAPPSN